jgi:hypothetical protein
LLTAKNCDTEVSHNMETLEPSLGNYAKKLSKPHPRHVIGQEGVCKKVNFPYKSQFDTFSAYESKQTMRLSAQICREIPILRLMQ